MTEILNKFLTTIKNLDNYDLLREESNFLIMGTSITIKEYIEKNGNIFQTFSAAIDRKLYTCFIISLTDDDSHLQQFSQMPIFFISDEERQWEPMEMKELLDELVGKTFCQ